jgi:hypothetical protein
MFVFVVSANTTAKCEVNLVFYGAVLHEIFMYGVQIYWQVKGLGCLSVIRHVVQTYEGMDE